MVGLERGREEVKYVHKTGVRDVKSGASTRGTRPFVTATVTYYYLTRRSYTMKLRAIKRKHRRLERKKEGRTKTKREKNQRETWRTS